ncbi:hypothetical protein L210DRAFT_3500346 [Boletus edulis BED1]|uniref:Uncharacterized protein n=1 Tax=Boletus edulis BED1 TaxID=1328754 RepID=A0AAD4C7Q8_BOLED|nr:hypothetical protein L210DRAFT_3500346 [Boletus edulis BED1]
MTVASKKKPSKYGRSQKGNISTYNAQRSYESTLFKAEQSLTADERKRIQNRAMAEGAAQTPYSEEEESVPDKGKELDPRNWGQLDLDSDELDLNVQRSVLEQWNNRQTEKQTELDKEIVIAEDREKAKYAKAFKRQRLRADRRKREKEKRSKSLTPNTQPRTALDGPVSRMIHEALTVTGSGRRESVVRVIEPVRQIAPKSYLGRALGKVKQGGSSSPSFRQFLR